MVATRWCCVTRPADQTEAAPFLFLKTLDKRERFIADLTDTLSSCPFTLISAVINKAHLRELDLQPENPYALALRSCLRRTHDFLRQRGQVRRETSILFECRGKREDAELELVFRRLCDGGDGRGRMPKFSIEFFDKKSNLIGLQIADLVSTPIGQQVIRPERRNRAFEVIRQKLRSGPNGELLGWGLQVFPQKTKGPELTSAEALRRSGTTPDPVARIVPRRLQKASGVTAADQEQTQPRIRAGKKAPQALVRGAASLSALSYFRFAMNASMLRASTTIGTPPPTTSASLN
jgi:hypothetical protein